MKLNMDCVRAVMLCAEEYTDYNHYCYFISYQKNNVNDFLLDDPETPPAYQLELEKTYDNDDLFYAVEYCVKSGFVETLFSKDTYRIVNLRCSSTFTTSPLWTLGRTVPM